jgi:hypothetical protein
MLFKFAPTQSIGGTEKIVAAQHVTVTASDVVKTGLQRVTAAMVTLASDPTDDPLHVSVVIPGSGGDLTIKTWKNTSGTDPTPIAATTFGKAVSWIACGY